MKKSVVCALVSTAFLAASAATNGVAYAKDRYAPSAVMQSAYANLVSGKLEKAIAEYSVAVDLQEITPDDKARSLLNRALAHQRAGAHEQAVADYSSAIEIDALGPKIRAVALYNRGIAHSKMNNHAQAVEDYTNALYLDPYLAEAFYSRANSLRETGQYEYALIDYARATKLNYKHLHLAFYGKALTLAKLGHNDEAAASLFRVYSIKPDFKPAHERLAALGVELPEKPSKRQIQLALLPAQNLLVDDIVTGSTKAPSTGVTKVARQQPVAPPSHLRAVKPAQATDYIAQATPAPKPAKPVVLDAPDTFTVASVKPVPSIKAETAPVASVPAPAEKQEVEVIAVSAPAPTANLNVKQPVVSDQFEGWTVQLVSRREADKAWENWASLKKKHGKLLSSKSAAVVRAEIEGRGIYYRLRVHQLDKKEARGLCRKLKSKGTGCFVSKTTG